jgi:hypothetical protein
MKNLSNDNSEFLSEEQIKRFNELRYEQYIKEEKKFQDEREKLLRIHAHEKDKQ